jgi:hypothetical protein
MLLRTITALTCSCILATAAIAQTEKPMDNMKMDQPSNKPLPSPVAEANVTLNGKAIKVHYNSPSTRGRKIMGELVPYGKIWRTGANEATTLTTAGNLKIGDLAVPAGTYTLYTVPNADQWLLVVSKQTGQWGTEYDESKDLGRAPMQVHKLSSPQEAMSISFERTRGNTTELHVKWENTDVSVPITAE